MALRTGGSLVAIPKFIIGIRKDKASTRFLGAIFDRICIASLGRRSRLSQFLREFCVAASAAVVADCLVKCSRCR